MAISLTPVKLPAGKWVDLYAATGINVGLQIVVQNIGTSDAVLTESLVAPTSMYGHNIIEPLVFLSNKVGAVGAWAFSSVDGRLQVEED